MVDHPPPHLEAADLLQKSHIIHSGLKLCSCVTVSMPKVVTSVSLIVRASPDIASAGACGRWGNPWFIHSSVLYVQYNQRDAAHIYHVQKGGTEMKQNPVTQILIIFIHCQWAVILVYLSLILPRPNVSSLSKVLHRRAFQKDSCILISLSSNTIPYTCNMQLTKNEDFFQSQPLFALFFQ